MNSPPCEILHHLILKYKYWKHCPISCHFCTEFLYFKYPKYSSLGKYVQISIKQTLVSNFRPRHVGETERTFKERMSEHLRDINNSADKPINCHFRNHNEKDIVYAVLQRLGNENSKALRLLIEDIWIRKLNTLSPHGCNVQRNH